MARTIPSQRIYLDNAATTPLCAESRQAMLPWLEQGYGNPSSLHQEGRKAKDAIDSAREVLSNDLGCLFAEVLFTSGGTESANLAIVGTALNHVGSSRNRILLGASEHHCVINTESTLRALGFQVEFLPVDGQARVDIQALSDKLSEDVLLVSTMHANNELGTIQPIREIADIVHGQGSMLHTDAVQSFHAPGQNWKVSDLDADLVTMSAHKIYGPKGAGAIYIRAGVKLKPLVVGGGQEREMRGGTENVAAIAGFAAAVALARPNSDPIQSAREALISELANLGAIATVIDRSNVLSGHAHVRFPDIDAETMLIVLDRLGLSASSGAACSSGSIEPSHVLEACGYSAEESKYGLRFSFGRDATAALAHDAIQIVQSAVDQIRSRKD